MAGRCEDSDRCVRWLGRTPKQIKNKHLHLRGGAYRKPYSTGYGFLAYYNICKISYSIIK